MNNSGILISVVVPVFNESSNIPSMHDSLARIASTEVQYEWEFIFVDDGSHDGSSELLEELHNHDQRIKILSFTRNFGHQAALTAGIEAATGQAVITLDGDGQHPPDLIPVFLRAWESGAKIVQGVRILSTASPAKQLTSRMFYRIINRLADIHIKPNAADFRLMSREAADTFKAFAEQGRFIRGMISWMGYETKEIPYSEIPRTKGVAKFTPWKMLRFAVDAITSFSAAPLHAATVLGFSITAFAAMYTIYALGVFFFARETTVPGWTSLIVVQLFIGGVQLTCLGIIGEYLFRLYGEAKHRPLYVIRKRKGL